MWTHSLHSYGLPAWTGSLPMSFSTKFVFIPILCCTVSNEYNLQNRLVFHPMNSEYWIDSSLDFGDSDSLTPAGLSTLTLHLFFQPAVHKYRDIPADQQCLYNVDLYIIMIEQLEREACIAIRGTGSRHLTRPFFFPKLNSPLTLREAISTVSSIP
jgi:hypothetical protein